MSAAVAVLSTGLVTPVGLTAAASCAAMRAKLTNPTDTRFIDSGGQWIVGHEVALQQPWRGLDKLARMACMAIEEAAGDMPRNEWSTLPMLLCVAESERPGRLEGLDEQLFPAIEVLLGTHFDARSAVVPQGRVSVAIALSQARTLLQDGGIRQVLIVAADSLLHWPTLTHYEAQDRLLTGHNSNGFMPGEGAGALLLGKPGAARQLVCSGVGFGVEPAPLDSGRPLRGDGLTQAIGAALADAKCQMHDMDLRITDLSGEQYYFKEASLALSRTLRQRRAEFDIWHPAECTGESGALAGATVVALADAACRKGFSHGPNILAHMANDAGRRAAMAFHFRSTA